MRSKWTVSQIALLCLSRVSWAQHTESSVPTDLSVAFDPNSIILQVNYNGQAQSGFTDGTHFTAQQTSQTPVFALGDASGINTQIQFVLAMIDTTNDERVLHFVQAGFAADGTETGLASSSQPAVPYAAPGTLGETGSRQYSWLLYQQVGDFPARNLPKSGQVFSVEQFQTLNGLQPALAGIAMVVDLTAGSSAASTTGSSVASSSSSNSALMQSTTAAVMTQTTMSSSTLMMSSTMSSAMQSIVPATDSSMSTQATTESMSMMTMSQAPAAPTTNSNPNLFGVTTIATSVMPATMSMTTTSSSAAATATKNAASPRHGRSSLGFTTWALLSLGVWVWIG